MAHEVFICHANQDRNIAISVCSALEMSNINCWMAPRDVLTGENWDKAITKALSQSLVMILIFSGHSNESDYCVNEVNIAFDNKKEIIPFFIDDTVPSGAMQLYLKRKQWLYANTQPIEPHLKQLVNEVKRQLSQIKDRDATIKAKQEAEAARKELEKEKAEETKTIKEIEAAREARHTTQQARQQSGKAKLGTFKIWLGIIIALGGLFVAWFFALMFTIGFGGAKWQENQQWISAFGFVMVFGLCGIIPGVLFIIFGTARGLVTKPLARISNWWWVLPVMLGVCGGILSWLKLKNNNWLQARNMLIVSIVVSFLLLTGTIPKMIEKEKEVQIKNQPDITFSDNDTANSILTTIIKTTDISTTTTTTLPTTSAILNSTTTKAPAIPVYSISGKVIADADGKPIDKVCVYAEDITTHERIDTAYTGTDGTYILANIRDGVCYVKAAPSDDKLPYSDEWFNNTYNISMAKKVIVDKSIIGINFALAKGGSISGNVYDGNGKVSQVAVTVECYRLVDGNLEFWTTTTDRQGKYALYGLPYAEYTVLSGLNDVKISGEYTNYVLEYYPEKARKAEAGLVTVSEDTNPANINFTLEYGGSISGELVGMNAFENIENAHIVITEYNTGEWVGETFTKWDGTYIVRGLPVGQYRVYADTDWNNSPYIATYYSDKKPRNFSTATPYSNATPVSVIYDQDTPGITFFLLPK
jgi:hypothetical protein